jgi:hypothetical protein
MVSNRDQPDVNWALDHYTTGIFNAKINLLIYKNVKKDKPR